jgi:hypothetical protein
MVEDVPGALERSTTDEKTPLNRVSFWTPFQSSDNEGLPCHFVFPG